MLSSSIFHKISVKAFTRRASSRGIDIISPIIGLSDDRTQFYKLARDFADKELKPNASKWDRDAYFCVDSFRKFGHIGFGGMFVSQDMGGSSLNRSDAIVIIEALATGCVSTTALLTIHNANAWVIDKYGSDIQRQKWLPSLVNMDMLISFCLTEPGDLSQSKRSFSNLTTSLIFV